MVKGSYRVLSLLLNVTGGATRYVRSALSRAYPCTSEACGETQGQTGHQSAEGPPKQQ